MNKYVIVGGVAAGATCAARLRRLDEHAQITIVEKGPAVSYANCGLPYYIGGVIQNRKALFVASKESMKGKYNIDVLENTQALDIDEESRTVAVKNLVTGDTDKLEYSSLLIATGSTPIVPPFEGIDGKRVFTLWSVPDTDKLKNFLNENNIKTAIVVGGGFIGIETAENLVHLGIKVHLVEMAPQVMAPFDKDMSKILENHLEENGVELHLGKGMVSIHDDGRLAKLDDGSSLNSDMILLSIGVKPNNEFAKKVGIQLNERGYAVVDDFMRTSKPYIYAAGDITLSKDYITGEKKCVPLAGPANKQGRIAADNMYADLKSPENAKELREIKKDIKNSNYRFEYTGSHGTSIAKIFDLTAASTGLNEKQLQKSGKVYMKDYAYSLLHPQSHAGYYPGALPMTIKLIFSMTDGRVIGCQIIGYDGVEGRIDTVATSIRFKGNIYDLTDLELAYAPPYSSAKDPINMAGYAAQNILDGTSEPATWKEALKASESGAGKLLDIREKEEYLAFKIDNVPNIPLTELRRNLDKLDKNTLYYLYCAVGLRGYIAERLLRQNGFKVKNILGGTRTYQVIYGKTKKNKLSNDSGKSEINDKNISREESAAEVQILNVCGMSCPGPIVEVSRKIADLSPGQMLHVTATDPGFVNDIDAWCGNTGNVLVKKGKENGTWFAEIKKAGSDNEKNVALEAGGKNLRSTAENTVKEKTMIIFSGDLDKAIASFVIANGAAAMGNKVNMFFTFWGLSIIRKPNPPAVRKDFIGKMFGAMLPKGSRKLAVSKMNFGGMGANMIRNVMKNKNINSLEELIKSAQKAGVKMTACQMSMDVMGLTKDELIDGVEVGGVASMLADNDRSNMNLFI